MTIPLCAVVQVGVNGESPTCGGSQPDTPPPMVGCTPTHLDDTFWTSVPGFFFWIPGPNIWARTGTAPATSPSLLAIGGWNVNTFRPTTMRLTFRVEEHVGNAFPASIDFFLDDTDAVQLGSTNTIVTEIGTHTIEIALDYSSSLPGAGIEALLVNTDMYIGGPAITCIQFLGA